MPDTFLSMSNNSVFCKQEPLHTHTHTYSLGDTHTLKIDNLKTLPNHTYAGKYID